jgi:hypothetical protein
MVKPGNVNGLDIIQLSNSFFGSSHGSAKIRLTFCLNLGIVPHWATQQQQKTFVLPGSFKNRTPLARMGAW